MPTLDHYGTLGVDSGATSEEIKRAYRKLARELHPDMNGNQSPESQQSAAERFKQVAIAYETVGDAVKRQAYDASLSSLSGNFFGGRYSSDYAGNYGFAEDDYSYGCTYQERPKPQPETITHCGVQVHIIYDHETWWGMRARASFALSDAEVLRDNNDVLAQTYIHQWCATGDGGKVLFTFGHWFDYDQRLNEWKAEQEKERAQNTFFEELQPLQQQCSTLADKGWPTGTLSSLINQAREVISRYKERWNASTTQQVKAAIKAVANEVTRLQAGDLLDLLVSGLLDGSITHQDLPYNERAMRQLIALEIRTRHEGLVTAFTHESLREFYRKRLQGVTSYSRIWKYNLRIELEKDAVSEEDEIALEYAPRCIELQGRSSKASRYTVDYHYVEVEEQIVPVGAITVPLNVYERNAVEYGKKSGFPELPHGIQLWLIITVDGKEIAHGFDNEALAQRIAKYEKAKRRGKVLRGVGDSPLTGRRWSPIESSGVPNWYVGARPRW